MEDEAKSERPLGPGVGSPGSTETVPGTDVLEPGHVYQTRADSRFGGGQR